MMLRPFLLSLLVLTSVAGCGRQNDVPPPLTSAEELMPLSPLSRVVDREAPPVVLGTLAGDSLRLDAFKGNVLLVNFWATWCAPCRIEIPELIELQQALSSDSFSVIGIASVLYEEEHPEVQAFVEEMGINYPIGLDIKEAARAFGGVYALPTTFIIDRDFIVRHRFTGLPNRPLRPMIDALLVD